MAPTPVAAPARSSPAADLDRLAIDTIRTLSMDAVEAAKSGHPGTPMALAPVAYTVWKDFCGMTPPIQPGQIATDLCSPADTHRCCFIRSSTWLAFAAEGQPMHRGMSRL